MKLVYSLFFSLFLIAQSASAFTQTELNTLKSAAQAEPSIQGCLTDGNDVCVADWFNAASAYIVWKTSVTAEEYHNSAIVWTAVDGLTNGKARIWEWMSRFNNINPSQINVRQGFADAFGAGSATVTAALTLSKRAATNAEKSLAAGIGTNANPGVMTFEGRISPNDIYLIMGR
jgi:hypothetical protein